MMLHKRELRKGSQAEVHAGTPVLMRVDFNIPWKKSQGDLDDGGKRGRIAQAIPEIQNMAKKKAIVALVTHWGDPHGKSDASMSTKRLVPLI